jgi:hypothetical protein
LFSSFRRQSASITAGCKEAVLDNVILNHIK